MLLVGFILGLVAVGYTARPAQPEVVEYSHSARITIDPNDVPAGTDLVHIEAKEINDLTGDRFEEGYDFGYNAVYPVFHYPELNDGKYHVFRVKYGTQVEDNVEWSEFSLETRYLHADESRFSLDLMRRNWAMAKEHCLTEGKRLAVIHGQKTNAEVARLLNEHQSELEQGAAWIGLYDSHYNDDNAKTSWNWVDNSIYKFSQFELGAAVSRSELHSAVVAVNARGEWETRSPDEKLPFICEKGITQRAKISEVKVGLSEADLI